MDEFVGRESAAVLGLALLVLTSGCGFLGGGGGGTNATNGTATGTIQTGAVGGGTTATSAPATTGTATPASTPANGTATSSANGTATPGATTNATNGTTASDNGTATDDARSSFTRQFVEFAGDNAGELQSVDERGELLLVNYTLPASARVNASLARLPDPDATTADPLVGSIRDYVVDFDTVVGRDRDAYADWAVERAVFHYHFANGTLAGRYRMADYWAVQRRDRGAVTLDTLTERTVNTAMRWDSTDDGGWVPRAGYVETFRENLALTLDVENLTVERYRTTLFVSYTSTAADRAALDQEIRLALGTYEGLHSFLYNASADTYRTAPDTEPRVLDLEVNWPSNSESLLGRVSLWELTANDSTRTTTPSLDEIQAALERNSIVTDDRFRGSP